MIYKGDCLKVMPELIKQGVKADMILCDLPYGTTACKWDTVIPFEPLWDCYKGLIKDNGAVVLFGSQPFTSALVMSNIKWFKYEWIWDKINGSSFLNAKKQPLRCYENISIFYDKQPIYNPQLIKRLKKNIRDPKREYGDGSNTVYNKTRANFLFNSKRDIPLENGYPKNIIQINNKNAELHPTKVLHPTQKPVPLFEYLIRTYTNEGDLVLDNCAGSGTTAIACMNTNRKYICIEQDEKYFEVMKKRIENHVIQTEMQLT